VIAEARRPVREGLGADSDATAVVADRVRFWSVLAEEEDRAVTVDLAEGPLPVRVAAADLAAAVDALLGNVFAHTPEGTGFGVTVQARPGGGARVVVADTGPGMPDASGALVRGHSGAGSTGLGLDIAQRTARASGGTVELSSSTAGTTVTLELGPLPG
jgi:signal transduction histidine kinase